MSDSGAVWISPLHFFEIVAAMRQRAALRDGMSALSAVDVGHDGGSSYVEALVNAVGESRTMIASSIEVAGRALVIAGTRVVDADTAEDGTTYWSMPSPYSTMPANEDDYERWADDQEQYYEDLSDYMSETEDLVDEGG
jgi:hypothetical protein